MITVLRFVDGLNVENLEGWIYTNDKAELIDLIDAVANLIPELKPMLDVIRSVDVSDYKKPGKIELGRYTENNKLIKLVALID